MARNIRLFPMLMAAVLLTACTAGTTGGTNTEPAPAASSAAPVQSSAASVREDDVDDSIDEQILFDDAESGIKITAASLSREADGSVELKLRCENNGDVAYTFSSEYACMNGCIFDFNYAYEEVAPGKKANLIISYRAEELEPYGITTIGTLEPNISIRNTETSDKILEPTTFTVKTHAADSLDFVYTPSGDSLYEADGLLITKGTVKINGSYADLDISVVNNTGETIYYTCGDSSINDFVVSGYISTAGSNGIESGKCYHGLLAFDLSTLDESDLGDTNTLVFDLIFKHDNHYDGPVFASLEDITVEF